MIDILSVPMRENDAGAATVGEYLRDLLLAVWVERDLFSGKRPFGNSSWEFEIYRALIEGGVVAGKLPDEDGFGDELLEPDRQRADKLIEEAIRKLFQ